jgi:hypothetical protein
MKTVSSPQSGPPTLHLTILGEEYLVPKDNLIWIFQDLGLIRFSSKFCWNGECKNCPVRFKLSPDGEEITERACQTPAQEGMMIVELPGEFYRSKSA